MAARKNKRDYTTTESQEQYRDRYSSNVKNIADMYEYRQEWLLTYIAQLDAMNQSQGNYIIGDVTASGPSSYIASGMDSEQLRDMSLKGSSGLTAEQINDWIKAKVGSRSSVMIGMGRAFIQAENASKIRADALVAHAAHESGWGTSSIVKSKYNWYGISAYDRSPYSSAYNYNGPEAGIIDGAVWIANNYVYSQQWNQYTFRKMRWNNGVHEYATDGYGPTNPVTGEYDDPKSWDQKICDIWSGAPAPIGGIAGGNDVANQNLSGFMKIIGGRVTPPTDPRGPYNSSLAKRAHPKGIFAMQKLPSDKFSPNLAGTTMSVAKEFYPGLLLIYEEMRKNNLLTGNKMLVNSAYRRIKPGTNSLDLGAHGWGGAIDIGAKGRKHAIQIADICWGIGFRAVAIGGNLSGGSGFTHVDGGPAASWGYGSGVYKGPGSMT